MRFLIAALLALTALSVGLAAEAKPRKKAHAVHYKVHKHYDARRHNVRHYDATPRWDTKKFWEDHDRWNGGGD